MDTTTASMAYGEEVELAQFTYKRTHHCDDWLKKFKAEGKKIPKEIITNVMQWLYDNNYRSKEVVTPDLCKVALKSMGLQQWYDYRAQISCIINGKSPVISPDRREIIRLMFMAIQAPFLKWKAIVDPERTNFLSYSYVLFKFSQMRKWDYHLQFFSLLKGKDKLKKQDEIWKGICQDMKWDFISSFTKEEELEAERIEKEKEYNRMQKRKKRESIINNSDIVTNNNNNNKKKRATKKKAI